MVSQPSARIDKVAQNALPCSLSSLCFHKQKAKYAHAVPPAKTSRRRARLTSLAAATSEQYPPDWANVRRRLAEDEDLSGAFADMPQRALSLRYSNNSNTESADPFSALSDAEELAIPAEYNANAISFFWRKHPDIVATRLVELTQTAGSLLASIGWDIFNDTFEENLPAHAKVVRETLTRLGPAYIKLGQALSARPDLLPEALISELRSLCHDVPPFPASQAVDRIEADLGRPLHEVYGKFEPVPMAAASLGQVHRAELRGSCDTVAIKVQRPRLKLAISRDVFILRRVCMAIKDVEEVRQRLCVDPVDLVDDWAAGLFSEMDYVKVRRRLVF
ncbi:hypothetical protein CYMTET_53675 [Cymbomonas tetramitiformis]|uniref:ABC1 atypical kinase-like domain-containing protein n=1 Tax=Cymbomonas tetramitiformis TaxID=36881 RepID=A0AAE0EQC5_9CHLO|nr:hypothetical protein CYMTET_53675 [Cymbomonas tetramitiformis]